MSNRDNRVTRRELFPSVSCGVLLAGRSICARAAGSPSPVVETAYGRVRGATVRGVHIFRGLPYGGPTEGAGRFLPPSKPARWAGVRDATVTGPRCVQGEGNIFLHPIIGEYFGGGRPDRVELAKQTDSENCLVLNVLTTGLRGKRPVMVYIHGGGLTSGSGLLTLYGDGLPREQDVVLVGVNHRLNVFGYTYLGGLSPKYATGNVGQLDLVAALEWVRDNIAQFGGDPGNVMILGESGGGAKVSALLAMPAAKGLFHRASVQSGSSQRAGTPDAGTESARRLLANLDLSENQVDELQKLPADKLFAAARGRGISGSMVVDGHSIPQQTWDPRAPEVSVTVPMLVGNDKDESTLFSLNNPALFELNAAGLRASLIKAGITEGDVDALLKLYLRDHPADMPTDLYFRISSDRGARRNAIWQAELKAEQGKANVYMWYCQWNTPLGEGQAQNQIIPHVRSSAHHAPGRVSGIRTALASAQRRLGGVCTHRQSQPERAGLARLQLAGSRNHDIRRSQERSSKRSGPRGAHHGPRSPFRRPTLSAKETQHGRYEVRYDSSFEEYLKASPFVV